MKNTIIRNIILLSILIISLLLCKSCDEFTDVGLPKNQITRDVVFKDDQLAKAAMAGIYRSLEESGFLSGSSSGAQVIWGSYIDELQSYGAATTDASIFYQLSHTASTDKISTVWNTSYTQIYNINAVIEGVENSDQLSTAVKAQLKGEALFLRSILHLYLALTYGAVPYVTTTAYEVNQSIGKISVDEVYLKCRNDLEASLALLPETLPKGSRIYPTKMASYALLARIGYYQSDWGSAKHYCDLVINNPQYQMEVLDKLFLKDSTSSIWQLLPYGAGYNTYQGNVFIIKTAPPSNVALRQDFISEFETGDKRFSSWVAQIKDSQNKTYYYPFKYQQYSSSATTMEYSVILRVEELYLIRAEAMLKMAQYNAAVADINAVRTRAGLNGIANTSDSAFLLNAIIKERRFELFTEFGHRFFDLRHYNLLDDVMHVKKSGWKPNFKLLPLPEKELLLNPNLNPQNNGY